MLAMQVASKQDGSKLLGGVVCAATASEKVIAEHHSHAADALSLLLCWL